MKLCEYAHIKCNRANDTCYDKKVKECIWYKKYEKIGVLELSKKIIRNYDSE